MRILFSPVGGSDPIKRMLDGPMLHCCRVYKLILCVCISRRVCLNMKTEISDILGHWKNWAKN